MTTDWVESPLRDQALTLGSGSCEPGGQDVGHIKSIKEAKTQKWALVQLHHVGEEPDTPRSHVVETILECMKGQQELAVYLEHLQYWQQVSASEADEASELRESTRPRRAC
eukprot:8604123-Pyramimonas_sp.AAC.1